MEEDPEAQKSGAGNMRSCGCQLGRPCTCAMGKKAKGLEDFKCGVCVNCLLNARALSNKRRREMRQCIKYTAYMEEKGYDHIMLRPGCVFRIKKPDWDIESKSAFFTTIHRIRLAYIEATISSAKIIEEQKRLRKKYSNELIKAQEGLKELKNIKPSTTVSKNKAVLEYSYVDSDRFDAFSKQLISAEIVIPELKSKLEHVENVITIEEKNMKYIQEYVFNFAAEKIQLSLRNFRRHIRWKKVWKIFREDVELAAVVTLQGTFRMWQAKAKRNALRVAEQHRRQHQAAFLIQKFFIHLKRQQRAQTRQKMKEIKEKLRIQRENTMVQVYEILRVIVSGHYFRRWKEMERQATASKQQREKASVILIQKIYRGYRCRILYKQSKWKNALCDRLKQLIDRFFVRGDFWGFLLEVDGDYKRFMKEKSEEEEQATTFIEKMIREKQQKEEQTLQQWYMSSAFKSPLIKGVKNMQQNYTTSMNASSNTFLPEISGTQTVSDSLLHSALYEDIQKITNTTSEIKTEELIFPNEFSPKVIRHAMAEGYEVAEIVATLRGLQAQGKSTIDIELLLRKLQERAPLMKNPWKSERVMKKIIREQRHQSDTKRPKMKKEDQLGPNSAMSPAQYDFVLDGLTTVSSPTKTKQPSTQHPSHVEFITRNLLYSIAGGLKGSINRFVQVAAVKCFDWDTNRNEEDNENNFSTREMGHFVIVTRPGSEDDPFEKYLKLTSSLLKIRWEHAAFEAAKPYVDILKDHDCHSGYDLLYNTRSKGGVEELVKWNIPRTLAVSLYAVVSEVELQLSRISRRNVKTYLSFKDFYWKKMEEKEKIKFLPEMHLQKSPENIDNVLSIEYSIVEQLRLRMEKQVLGIFDENHECSTMKSALFKSIFVLCDDVASDEVELDPHFYEIFLKQLANDKQPEESKQNLIRSRIQRALEIVNYYLQELENIGITTIEEIYRHEDLFPSVLSMEIVKWYKTSAMNKQDSLSSSEGHKTKKKHQLRAKCASRPTIKGVLTPLVTEDKVSMVLRQEERGMLSSLRMPV